MTGADRRTLMLALRGWLDEDERNARRIVEHVFGRAIAGHSSYLRLVLDLVDGPIRLTAEEETIIETDCVPVADDAAPDAGTIKAA